MPAHVFVTNLTHDEVDNSELFGLFSRYVDVRSAKVVPGKGRALNGFIELTNSEDLERACQLDGLLFHGRPIKVMPCLSKRK
jgi:RNA recognition motif-containing protein